jgi:hypothetical protein
MADESGAGANWTIRKQREGSHLMGTQTILATMADELHVSVEFLAEALSQGRVMLDKFGNLSIKPVSNVKGD